jgi:CBS domain-containing protein
MSARAAWRLEETLGFQQVYRYAPGKADWLAAGLPREGEMAAVPRIGDVANPDVPICGPRETVGEARRRLDQSGQDACVVLSEHGRVVLGLARAKDLESDPHTAVEDVMDPGPVTYRPDTLLAELVEHVHESKRKVNRILVTTSDGVLVGILRPADAERVLEELHAQHAQHEQHAA